MKDTEKRKRVMARSMRLGHCICNPKQGCPCDSLREQDICPCAGERLAPPAGPVRLTHLVEKPGCASKIDQAALQRVLKDLPAINDPRVLIGVPAGDDAGVFKVNGELALVQTVDVFTPSVDDPYVFGQIAAANSVSDVYAMAGRPISALSIVGFPIREVPDAVMHDILRGGIDKMAEAGVAVIGGHSINDEQIKAGFAVTGLIDPERIATNADARPGDVVVLTKPIGTGIITFAAQIDRAPPAAAEAVPRSMASLNKVASELMVEFGAHACTDVTGFGLMGHLTAMAAASQVDVEVTWDDIPLFAGVIDCVAQGILPGAIERNRESVGDRVVLGEGVQPTTLDVCCDAQTSGGLLIALPESSARTFLTRLHDEGVPEAAVIGKVLTAGIGRVFLHSGGTRQIPEDRDGRRATQAVAEQAESTGQCCVELESGEVSSRQEGQERVETSCCAEGHGAGSAVAGEAEGVSEIQRSFQDFLKRANAPGALDAATKQAIALALSILAKCEPCTKIHLKKARAMGFSQDEIDEAAWMAIAFGGSPIMMFYNALKRT